MEELQPDRPMYYAMKIPLRNQVSLTNWLNFTIYEVFLQLWKHIYRFWTSPTSQPEAHTKVSLPMNSKVPEFFEKSPLSGTGKHPDFQVTSCLHFVTTNVDFVYIESE